MERDVSYKKYKNLPIKKIVMAFDFEDFITTVILQVISGVILAIVLSWWASNAEKRRQNQEFSFLIHHIYAAVCNEDYKELYYFLKLAGEKEKSTIQQILQMELTFEGQTGSFNLKIDDKLFFKNAEYALCVDLGFQAYIYDAEVKNQEGEGSYYFFLRPESSKLENSPEVFENFQKYIVNRAHQFDLKI
ncbi:MAG TPA: hypothetical protein VKK79_02920 [Candidatus Lokiarchaeia archaeon]|nr:hypothetical protein [Candidatus Lokiarchaeia archaeon]